MRKFPRHGFDLDYLQYQDLLKNYRIKKVTKGNGEVWYYPQKKVLWFWVNMVGIDPYGCKNWANQVIRSDFKDSRKDIIEYLKPNLNSPEPKPPLKLKKTTSQ